MRQEAWQQRLLALLCVTLEILNWARAARARDWPARESFVVQLVVVAAAVVVCRLPNDDGDDDDNDDDDNGNGRNSGNARARLKLASWQASKLAS